MQIHYGDLKINFNKSDMDNFINLKNSLISSEKISLLISGLVLITTVTACGTAIIMKALDNKNLEDNQESLIKECN